MVKEDNQSTAKDVPAAIPAMERTKIAQLLPMLGLSALIVAYLWARTSESPTYSTCPAALPNPSVKILSIDPLIIHITEFVSPSERAYLMEIGNSLLAPSTTLDENGNEIPGSSFRTSSTAFLPFGDPCVKRITHRAADFQGYMRPGDINVQITAYQPGQQYKHHHDWYHKSPSTGTKKNTISTFFAILHSTCSDCGTEFPLINKTARAQYDQRWCEVIDCNKPVLTTRNVEGSALFWINLDARGRGRMDTLHSGLPANGGEKIGLNIWTDCKVEEIWDRGLFGGSMKPPNLSRAEVV